MCLILKALRDFVYPWFNSLAEAHTKLNLALSSFRARTVNIDMNVSNGVAVIPFSKIASDITETNYIDALIDVYSSNDYIICRKWHSKKCIYVFIRNYNGIPLTTGNLRFQITAFITM